MRDRELYATILGLKAPWTVDRVEVDLRGNAVHVWLQRESGAAVECPECGTAQTVYDHRDREWRHLDTCQLETRLHARVLKKGAQRLITGQLSTKERRVGR
jgi:transposase